MGQVLKRSEIDGFLAEKRKSNKRIVFTNGCFDILHVGHVRYLREASALGDLLFIGANSDRSVSELKGPSRPVQNQNDRAEILAALGFVGAVSIFDESTPYELIKIVRPQILVKGGDWAVDKIVGADLVLASGGQVKSLPFYPGHSTTSILEKILKL